MMVSDSVGSRSRSRPRFLFPSAVVAVHQWPMSMRALLGTFNWFPVLHIDSLSDLHLSTLFSPVNGARRGFDDDYVLRNQGAWLYDRQWALSTTTTVGTRVLTQVLTHKA